MSEQKLITEYPGIISEIKNEIKILENEAKVLKKLYVILDIMHDVPVPEIMEKYGVSQGSVYNWARQWENGGLDGLKRKPGTTGSSKLTKEEFEQLDESIQKLGLKTAVEVQDYVEKTYNVDYSIRQISRIMKKLGYSYIKKYETYEKMSGD